MIQIALRLDEPQGITLRALARRTRIRQADLLREAVSDLIAKYEASGIVVTDEMGEPPVAVEAPVIAEASLADGSTPSPSPEISK